MQSLFFELIRISVGAQKEFSKIPSAKEWAVLYQIAEKQAVLGICFTAVKKMAYSVPQPLYMKWLAVAAKIQQRNEEMNRKCAEVYDAILERGFKCVILKGQGVARYYMLRDESLELRTNSLGMLRQNGDIDVWLWKEGLSLKENKSEIIRFARTINSEAIDTVHHVSVEWFGTEVELHFEPAYFCNPFGNRRFRKWFCEYDKSLFQLSDNGFCIPNAEFNRVFMLAHVFRHCMIEGLGLRQVMDYYFLLSSFHGTHGEYGSFNANSNVNLDLNNDKVIKALGMARFEKAMKWVIGYVFERRDGEDSRKYGKMLLRHIMNGGNFGKFKSTTIASKHTHIGRFINQLAHDIQFMRYYPSEAVWVPLSMIREFVRIRI